jgi:hypothetical protein
MDFAGALADSLRAHPRVWAPGVLARAATEAGAQAWWLLEDSATVSGRARVIRRYLAHRSSSKHLAAAAAEVGVTDPLDFGTAVDELDADADALGITVARGKPLGSEGEVLPRYTERARAFLDATGAAGAYNLDSGTAHVELYMLLNGYLPARPVEGRATVWRSYVDRDAAWAAAHRCIQAVVFPAVRVADYFGWAEQRAILDGLIDEVDGVFHALSHLDEEGSGYGLQPQ